MLSIIVAIGNNYEIGKNNKLLCHLPEDLKHFKSITEGHSVLMGENTYLSLPKRPLPNRRNIVLCFEKGKNYEGCEMAYSLDEAIALCETDEETFIIGGASVYKQFFHKCDRLYITRMQATFKGADAFFPVIDDKEWKLISEEFHTADAKHCCNYIFQLYTKNNL